MVVCVPVWVLAQGHLLGKYPDGPVEFKAGAERKGFEIPQEFLDDISSWDDMGAAVEIRKLCGKVQEIVTRLGISTKPSAVITDGNLSVSWRKYWEQGRRVTKSVSGFLAT